ncbi:MAG: pyridoxine 5'-phosphate synthase [Okeania sp. SIO1H5]|uniref:pyridoxine 5'-phosphate synthase n=1 Tax=Okeania sp. SIO1H5 TaxID=2607777 RepID=UPI0013B7AC63|nr:pyridoxine 5'-phosphate synthase [Okeania sp. SIO1H5]NET23791.1 pyridoxine 5'-phosphate synthase [Okeania sp. SIO1H5]
MREPDPISAASLAELAGANGIAAHLRQDRRAVQERDVRLLRQTVTTHLNLIMAPGAAMLQFAIDVLPDMVTLVPEKREELTTEGGLNVASNQTEIAKMVESLRKHDVDVSLFIEPEVSHIKSAIKTGARFVQFNTSAYGNAYDFGGDNNQWQEELSQIQNMLQYAHKCNLWVNGGGGLNYQNVIPLARLEGWEEITVGHAVSARAALVGMDRAVRDMVALVS